MPVHSEEATTARKQGNTSKLQLIFTHCSFVTAGFDQFQMVSQRQIPIRMNRFLKRKIVFVFLIC